VEPGVGATHSARRDSSQIRTDRIPGGPVGGQDAYLRQREGAENFPVAMRVLPGAIRRDLQAIYDVVRVIDDIGDEPADVGQAERPDPAAERERRLRALEDFALDAGRAWANGEPASPVLRALVPVIARRALPLSAFDDLIEANRRDQIDHEYRDGAQLDAYCRLSAAPIGRLVLAVFGVPADAQLTEQSDQVCAALQVLEHLQDVGEDRARGRIYLPADARESFGVAPEDLDAPTASPQLRALIRHLAAAERQRLAAAAPLLSRLHGWARLAVAGYVAGGLAALDALRRCDGDVLGSDPAARRRDVLRHLPAALAGRLPRAPQPVGAAS
jgi:squalene synthase HpnC